ncbi:MAG: N-acetylneuraminate synthase family protein, partial [Tepidisphaeraceae bacterium]
MNIANRTISAGSPVFVIAEIGVNHDGSLATALRLVNEAADAGADAVKLQVFGAERLMHRSAMFADYQQSRVDADNPIEMLRQYELSAADLQQIASTCRDRNLAVIATPFSPDDVPVVAAFADAIKIASPDLVNRLLLRRAVATGLPLIVSTGASSQ